MLTERRTAGSRQKGVCFYFFGAEKNQHAPALHLLNMRHAATQTRPGVCRIHFHLRHLIVSRRSPCSRGRRGESAVHVWRGRVVAAATADRLGESSEFRALVFGGSVSLAFIATRFARSFACAGKTVKVNVFSYLAVCRGRADVRCGRRLLE